MKSLRKIMGRFQLGIWMAIGALLLISLAWLMQAYSLINWESALRLGLQNASFSGDAAEQLMAKKEKGEAIADLIWPLPLTILALHGIMKKRLYGFTTAMMVFAICVYFPLFYIFQLWDTHMETAAGAVLLWGIPSLLGIAGLWANRETYQIKHPTP